MTNAGVGMYILISRLWKIIWGNSNIELKRIVTFVIRNS